MSAFLLDFIETSFNNLRKNQEFNMSTATKAFAIVAGVGPGTVSLTLGIR